MQQNLDERLTSVTSRPRRFRWLTALTGLLVACGHAEEPPACRDGAFEQVVEGIAGPVSPAGRRAVHYRIPRPELQLHDIAVAPDGAVWYADLLNSCIGRLDPVSGRFSERSEEHTSELQSPCNLVCRLLLEKKKKNEVRN